jgi:hypothetical protein
VHFIGSSILSQTGIFRTFLYIKLKINLAPGGNYICRSGGGEGGSGGGGAITVLRVNEHKKRVRAAQPIPANIYMFVLN